MTESQGKIYLERESFIQSMQKLIEEPKAQRRAEKRALPDFAKTYNKQEVAALANPSGSHSMVTIADYFNVHYATISDGLKDLKARFSMS